MSICVIGAGINGLTTARLIQQSDPRIKVHIIAAQLTPDTTSDVAAGIWAPALLPDKRMKLLEHWSSATYKHVFDLYQTDSLKYGAGLKTGFVLTTYGEPRLIDEENYWSKYVPQYRPLTDEDARRFRLPDDVDIDKSLFVTTLYLESSRYLPVLQQEFMNAGGTIEIRRIRSLDELANYDIIVNCSGLGSIQLFKDPELYPVRGQILRVRAPFLKHFYMINDHHYIYLNHEYAILGGTYDRVAVQLSTKPIKFHGCDYESKTYSGNTDPTPSQSDTDGILNVVTRFVPSLSRTPIEKIQVGFRPGRDQIRVECTHERIGERSIPVVHNYGQTGCGITMHYGCSMDAARLAVDAVHQKSRL